MYCRSCLAANPDGAQKCAQCGAPLADAIPPPMQGGPRIDLDAEPAAPPATPGVPSSQDPGPTLRQTPKPPADDFNLAPELEKKADLGPPPAPPPAEPKETKDGEPKPEMPKDNKQNIIIFLAILGLTLPLSVCFCSVCFVPCPNIIGFVFGLMALLEANKVKPLYEADDLPGATLASVNAARWLKIGIIVTAALVMMMGAWYALRILLTSTNAFKNIFNRG